MDLISELRNKQGGMTQAEFARLLNISPAMLCKIYKGNRVIGEAVGRRIIRVYPDLQWLVVGYLMSKTGDPVECESKSSSRQSG